LPLSGTVGPHGTDNRKTQDWPVTDGDQRQRQWLHTALLEGPDGRLAPAFEIDERNYPSPEAARAAVSEAFDTLQREGIAAEFETTLLHPGEPGLPIPSWPEYRTRFAQWRRAPARRPRMLQVWLAGEMDRERVNGLQDALGLRRAGRMDDDSWDTPFGDLILSRDGDSWTVMHLHRHGPRKWSVSVLVHQGDLPSAEQVALWRDQIAAAATAAGLRVGEIWVQPDIGAQA
jgi:hypothetical protein